MMERMSNKVAPITGATGLGAACLPEFPQKQGVALAYVDFAAWRAKPNRC